MTSLPPLLEIPGELRNTIYELVILETPELRLFEGRVLSTPLACACRQIRTEMCGFLGSFEADSTLAAQNGLIPIRAKVINFDFTLLSEWLYSIELLPGEGERRSLSLFPLPRLSQTRALHIDLVLDLPVIDLAHVAESQLAIKVQVARDRKAIRSFNDAWNDAGTIALHHGSIFFLQQVPPYFSGPNGTAATSDDYGAKSYGLETPAGNLYMITCHVRFNFLSTSDESDNTSSGSFPSSFCHQGDYLDQLFGQKAATPGPWCAAWEWGPCASSFFKVIFGAMSRARARSFGLLWDVEFDSQLTRQQRNIVDDYRLRDGGMHKFKLIQLWDEIYKLDAVVKMMERMSLSDC